MGAIETHYEQYQEEEISIDELKKALKDQIPQQFQKAIKDHNSIINKINDYEENIVGQSPYQLSMLRFYYNKAEREAWKIAGYYKGQYQFYNGHALTKRGEYYIKARQSGNGSKTADINDSNYKSRSEEGKYLEISGIYEGYYVTWKGIAESYKGMQATYTYMMNAIDSEGG